MYSFIDSASEHAAALSHFHSYVLFFLIVVIVFVIWVLKLILKFVLFERNLLGFTPFESTFFGIQLTLPRAAFFFWSFFNVFKNTFLFDFANAFTILFSARKTLSWFGTKRTLYPDQGNSVNIFSSLPQLTPIEYEYRFVNKAGALLDLYLTRRAESKSAILDVFRRAKHDIAFLFPYDRVEIKHTGPYSSVESFVKLHLYTAAYSTSLKHENLAFLTLSTRPSNWQYSTVNLNAALGFFSHKTTFFYKSYSAYVTPFAIFATFHGSDSRALFYLFFQHVRHRKVLEWVWTCIPAAILMLLLYPSLILLYCYDRPYLTLPYVTFKAIGHQWYWSYEYSDFVASSESVSNEHIKFDSYMTHIDDMPFGQFRLLEVDRRIVLPIGICMRLITTSSDVLHSWAVPALGVKIDAVPGRLNQFWIVTDRPGTFYGQCSELCGVNHGFMPIAVECTTFTSFFNALNVAATI